MSANNHERCRLCEWNNPYSGCIYGEEALTKTQKFASESVETEQKARIALIELQSRSKRKTFTPKDLPRILALGVHIDLGLFNIKYKLNILRNDLSEKSATGCEAAKIMLASYEDLG